MKQYRQYATLCGLALSIILIAALLGCAGTAATQSTRRESPPEPEPINETTPEPLIDDEPAVYDLEEEMPEEDRIDPEELEESIEPIETDSVVVEEISVPEAASSYGIGYRVQIFASSERNAAESLKSKAEQETALPVYIEFEDGYYKVRVGDFATREDAAAARARLSGLYPDCWIVSTTVRK